MTTTALLIFTIVGGGFVISCAVFAFIMFSRFLDREKALAERFRAEHGPKKE